MPLMTLSTLYMKGYFRETTIFLSIYWDIPVFLILWQNKAYYQIRWFCYFSQFLSYYGSRYVEAHSLVIAVQKYVHIVYWIKVMESGKETVNSVFFRINLLNPAFMILIHLIITPDFSLYGSHIHMSKDAWAMQNILCWQIAFRPKQSSMICVSIFQHLL